MDQTQPVYQRWLAFPQPQKIKILKIVTFIFYALFLLFLVIYAFGGTGKSTRSIPETVIFMEMMPGSMMALRELSLRSDVNVAVIVLCVNSWNTNMTAAMDGARRFVKLLQKEGWTATPSIYYGNSLALADMKRSAESLKETGCTYCSIIPNNLRYLADIGFNGYKALSDIETTPEEPQFFAEPLETFLKSSTPQFLIVGPATDAAWFLQNHTSQRSRVRNIMIGGGAFTCAGNVEKFRKSNTVSEMNFFLDPEAADFLVRGEHGLPVTVMPLDVEVPFTGDTYNVMVTDVLADTTQYGTSAYVVATSMSTYQKMPQLSSNVMTPNLLTPLYYADLQLQNGASVSTIPATVLQGNDLDISGRSVRPPTGRAITVVLSIGNNVLKAYLQNAQRFLSPS